MFSIVSMVGNMHWQLPNDVVVGVVDNRKNSEKKFSTRLGTEKIFFDGTRIT